MDGSNDSAAWKALEKHSKDFKGTGFRLRDLFDADSDRFREYSLSHEGLLLDYSKNFLNSETIRLLLELAEQRQLTKAIDSMFSGEKVNTTEHRAALHVALRDPSDASSHPEISETLDRIERLVVDVHGGTWLGYAGDTISDVVNLGIGGSDLGPAMVCDALSPCANTKLNVHFVSNIDPSHLQNTLKNLRP
ncbi:MAG TPA: glucose-6-phosphate isomerase, partial [Gammaproteobacteria bacterium]|nr:glucose-6-phosphate isomerase [Gammaproteobacteria bacterium]